MPLPSAFKYAPPEEQQSLQADSFERDAREATATYPERREDGSVWEVTYRPADDSIVSERMVTPAPVPTETQGYGSEFESQGPTYDPAAAQARQGGDPFAQALQNFGRTIKEGVPGIGSDFPVVGGIGSFVGESIKQAAEPGPLRGIFGSPQESYRPTYATGGWQGAAESALNAPVLGTAEVAVQPFLSALKGSVPDVAQAAGRGLRAIDRATEVAPTPLYHGTNVPKPFEKLDTMPGGFVYLTKDPEYAAGYAAELPGATPEAGPRMFKVTLDPKAKIKKVDFDELSSASSGVTRNPDAAAYRYASEQGADVLQYGDIYMVRNPNVIRYGPGETRPGIVTRAQQTLEGQGGQVLSRGRQLPAEEAGFLRLEPGDIGGGTPSEGGALPVMPSNPVAKLTALIKEAKPARSATEAMRSEELRGRVGRAAGILESGRGEEAFRASTAALKGSLPTAPFHPLDAAFAPDEITGLFEQIRTADLPYFTKLNTQGALSKLLLGEIPQRAEIGLLEDMFGKELAQALVSRDVSGWQRAREAITNVAGIPRTLVASVDISAPFRQGLLLSRHKAWRDAWGPMLKSFTKEANAEAVDATIRNRPMYEMGEQSGLYLAPLKPSAGRQLTTREEQFTSNIPQKLKIFGWSPVRSSERAYVTFLNKLRSDHFDNIAQNWEGMGKTEAEFRRLGSYINAATGRGSLGKLETIAPELNTLFFSPRFVVSRAQVGQQLGREVMRGGNPELRNEIAKDIASTLLLGSSVLTMLKLGGADVSIDPRNPDFGRGKIGDTRVDFWGGFQPMIRYLAQAVSGTGVSSRTGEEYKADPTHTLLRFFESKLAPTPSLLLDLWRGKTFTGEDVTLAGEAEKTLVPLLIQDIKDAVESEGLIGAPLGALGGVGVGVQTYGEEPTSTSSNLRSGNLRGGSLR